MSRRGENIYKRKDLRWEGRYIKYYNENGKAVYGYVYASTYSEVKQKLFETKQRAGNNPTNTTINSNSETFKTVLVNWTKMLQINTKESTFARYNHLINSHIVPFLGEYQTSQITNQLVENLIKHLLTNGRKDGKGGLSNKTVADILVLVKRSIAYASDCGYVINCKLNKVSVRTTSPEMKVFTLEEQRYLHTYLTKDMTSEKLGILLCLYTGIRIGELCALKWKNINTVSNVLEIRKTMIRIQNTNNNESQKTKLIISEPKSRCSIRDIPIPNCIMNYILDSVGPPDAYVLSGSVEQAIEPRTMQNKFHKHLLACGVTDTNFHTLRHTFATRCVEIGFEIKSLSEILGHANVNITLNRYVHPSIDLKKENMQKLNSIAL